MPNENVMPFGTCKDIVADIHKRIEKVAQDAEDDITKQEERVDRLEGRIGSLEQFKAGTEVEMHNLVKQLKSLVSTIRWMTATLIVTLVGFFMWYIQTMPR